MIVTDPKIVDELKRLADERSGFLRAEDVVEAARPETSVLHSRFEWDDSEAARQYRLEQARKLIRVTVEIIGTSTAHSRVFVSLRSDRDLDGGGYRSMVAVMSDVDMRQQLLRDALEEMQYFERKYAALNELSRVFDVMSEVKEKIAVGQEQQMAV